MEHSSPPSSRPPEPDLWQRLEALIDSLDQRLRANGDEGSATRLILAAAVEKIGCAWSLATFARGGEFQVSLQEWLRHCQAGTEKAFTAGQLPNDAVPVIEPGTPDQRGGFWTKHNAASHVSYWRPVGNAQKPVGWLALGFSSLLPAASQQAIAEIANVLSEMLHERFQASLAKQLQLVVDDHHQLALWSREAAKRPFEKLHQSMAHLVAERSNAERVWILERVNGNAAQILGVSDSPVWDSKSDWVNQVKQAAHEALSHSRSASNTDDSSPPHSVRWFQIQGVLPTRQVWAAIESRSPDWIWVFENDQLGDVDSRESRWALLSAARDAVERESDSRRSWLSRKSRRMAGTGGVPLRRWVGAILFVGLLGIALWPVPLRVVAIGELQPVNQRHVFAPDDGRLLELLVSDGELVEQGQTLAILVNDQLRQQLAEIDGTIKSLDAEIDSLRSRLAAINVLDAQQASQAQQLRSRSAVLETQRQGLVAEHGLLLEREKQLTITSPVAGEVITRDLKRRLETRPVERGQSLMVIADRSGEWQVRARVAVEEISPLSVSSAESESPSSVNHSDTKIVIESHVSDAQRWSGRDLMLGGATLFDSSESTAAQVELIATLTDKVDEQTRPGSQVTLRVDCGRRPLGYVLFRRLIEGARRYGWW